MPTYQYACTACGERVEAVQSFTDAPLTECPACGGALRKVFSAVGVVFKGSGFYKTDSRTTGGAKKEPAGDKAPAASSGSDSLTSGPAAAPASSASSAAASTPASKTA